MSGRQRHMVGKQPRAFNAKGLLKELQRDQQPPIRAVAVKPLAPAVAPEQPLAVRRGLIVGRQAVSKSLLTDLTEYFGTQTGVDYRPYVPTLIYATQTLLQKTFRTPDYEAATRDRLAVVRQHDSRAGTRLQLPIAAIVTEFHKGTGKVSLAFKIEHSDEKEYVYQERRNVLTAYSPEGEAVKTRRPAMIDVGRLSLKGPMRQQFDPAELHLHVPMPEHIELEPVDVVDLREPTKLL